jgi:predicted transcriptional regulator
MQPHCNNKFDILASILEIGNVNAARQAEILNTAKIANSMFKEYLLFPYQHGLIEIEETDLRQRTYISLQSVIP